MDLKYLARFLSFIFCFETNFVVPKPILSLNWIRKIYMDASDHCHHNSATIYWSLERFLILSNSPKLVKTHQNHHINTTLHFLEKCFTMQVVNAITLKRVEIMAASENVGAVHAMYQMRIINHFERSILSSSRTTSGIREKSSVQLSQQRESLSKHVKKIKLKVAKVRRSE